MSGFSMPEGVTHVVHIGAGTGAEVAEYVAAGLDPIILVDCDAQALVHLHKLAQQYPAVQVIEAAVSARPEATVFYRCNFPDLSGLAAPTAALQTLFPGVQVLAQEPVNPLSPVDLLGQCDLPADQPGFLVVEAPAEAHGIIASLKDAGLLARFSQLRLQEGTAPLYAGAPGLENLRGALEEIGYQTEVDDRSEDPDRPYLKGQRAVLTSEARQLVQSLTLALQDSQDTLAKVQAAQSETERKLDQKSAQFDGLLIETKIEQAAAQEARQELNAEQSKRLSAEADLANLSASREADRLRLAELEKEILQQKEAGQAAIKEAGQTEAALRKELSEAWQMSQSFEARCKELAEQLDADLANQREEFQVQIQDLRDKADLAQQSLITALRMQDLRETDLRELQLRHGELKARKEAQDRLLHRLQGRLSNLLSAPADTLALSQQDQDATPKEISSRKGSGKKASGRRKKSTAR